MAELETVEKPEIDVDAMTDEEFAEFKGKMSQEEEKPAETAAPEPAQEPKTEDTAAPDDDDDDDLPPKSETVSFSRFHRTNERRKAAEKAAQEALERGIRAEERLAALLETQKAAPAEPKQEPVTEIPGDDDIVGTIQWAKKELLAQKEQAAQQAKQTEEQTRQQREWDAIYTEVNRDYEVKTKADPAIVDAHNALRKSIGEELLAMGYTQQQALQEISNIENQHLAYVHSKKLDLGSYIKTLAKARGWAEKSATPDPQQEIANIAQREEARKASISLGKTGGAAADIGKITPQQIVDMTDEEFAAYKEKHSILEAFQ